MSTFTSAMRRASLGAWRALPGAVLAVPRGHEQYKAEQRERPVIDRAKSGCLSGCLSWILFGPFVVGILTLLLRLLLPLVIGAAVVAFASLTGLLWGAGAGVDAFAAWLRSRRSRPA